MSSRTSCNLEAAGQSSDLGRHYLATLEKQEDRFAEIDKQIAALDTDVEAKRKAAEEAVRQLTL